MKILIFLASFCMLSVLPNAYASKPILKEADSMLLKSCRKNDFEGISQAINEGADPNIRDHKKNTPLILISRKKCADQDAPCSKQTVSAAGLLIKHGAMIDLENTAHQTALYKAIQAGNQPLVNYLAEQGASLEKVKWVSHVLVQYQRYGMRFNSACGMIKMIADLGVPLHTGGLNPPLILAVKICKDPKMAHCLLEAGADPFAVNDYLQTPLMWIASFDNIDLLKTVLSRSKPDQVNMKTKTGAAALHWAAAKGRFDHINLLLEAGADIMARNRSGRTPLHLTTKNRYKFAEKDFIQSARILIQNGADINAADNSGDTPLLLASDNGNPDFIRMLLENGADPSIKNKTDTSAIFRLAGRGKTEAIQVFCSAKADLNMVSKISGTPLMEAIYRNHAETALKLITCGADIHYRDRHGETALFNAASKGNRFLPVIKKLIDLGADLNIQGLHKKTALMSASGADAAVILIENGADIHLEDHKKRTALFYAAEKDESFRPVVRLLIKSQADVNHRDQSGTTPLMTVKDAECAEMLIENGADIHLKNNKGRTALFFSAKKDKSFQSVVRRLLDLQADVNIQDVNGDTPLMGVKDVEIAKILIEGGADIKITNKRNLSALDYAVRYRRKKIAELLKSHHSPSL